MKKLLFITSFISLISCEKDIIVQPTPEPQKQEIRLYGKWLLVDGYVYVENLTTHSKIKYNYFSQSQIENGLRYNKDLNCGNIGTYSLTFEKIKLNQTTWSFYQPNMVPGYGEFVLNSDTLNPYGFYVTKNNWTIIEYPESNQNNMQLGGSSKPISAEIYSYSDSIVNFYVQEAYTSGCGNNYRYISELRFKKIESW